MSAMNSEQFFLKWNNFESNLASGFADLLQREAMVDVTLAAEGKIVQAHKIILSICSSYFRNMFQVNPCQHPIVVLKDVRYQELTDMLDFMYKGEANVRQEDLPSFLKLAETLKIKGLAGSPGELDESSRKSFSESQFSNLAQDSSSFVRDEPTNNFLDKDSITARKKSKRCTSPFGYAESKDLPPTANIKLESEECDNNFVRSNVNNCGRIPNMKEERLSDISADSYGENRVSYDNLDTEKNAGPSSLDENSETLPQGIDEREKPYSFVESCYGGRLLILDGFKYRKRYTNSGKSYWSCCTPQCLAKGILHPNGDFRQTNSKHNHKPDFEDIQRKEKLVELKKSALNVSAPGKELLEALDIKTDIKKHLNFIRTCRRRKQKNSPFRTPVNVGRNYKLLPSRIASKELILYAGYIFRQDSVNPRNQKCKYWRCRVNKCKARAKTDVAGNLSICNPIHYHSLENRQEVSKYIKRMTENSDVLLIDAKVNENSVQSSTKKLKTKLKKTRSKKQEKVFKAEGESIPAEEINPPTESETFCLEKLMAETLADNYCDSIQITDSILLKNE